MSNEVTKETEEVAGGDPSVTEDKKEETPVVTAVAEETEQPVSNEEDFGAILEKFEQEQTTFHAGETVTGKVIEVSDHGVIIDFGYKSEGVAPIEEFTGSDGEITVKEGDEVEVVIKNIHSGDAPPILSRDDALRRKSWDVLEKAYNKGTPVKGLVIDKTKGGLRVDIDGVEGFLPGSLTDSRPAHNLDSFIGKEIEAKVIKFSRKRSNIVLSRKALTDEVMNQQKAETLSKIELGYVVEGVIKNLTEYGAFVDIGGIDGLLHVTDMSWGRLQNPSELFKPGETVQVKVLKLDKEREKVSLGYKQLIPDPWSSVIEIYPVGARIKGKVSSITEYGAFIELEPGVEGLVHVSEMSWSKRTKSPKQLVKVGEEVEVQVLGVDTEDRRISLGMRQLQPNPWNSIAGKYRVGMTVSGKVRNITDFGAFIELEEGVDGLVHISDISRSKKIRHPKDVLQRGEEVQAVITSIDTEGQRLSLSMKELAPNAWDTFVATHKPGDVVRGKISRFAGFGVFVELADGLEGLCHISELSDERIEKPEAIFHIGQELDFKILRIEQDNQKIGLSARAVGKEDEPVIDVKSYSTGAKSGMASLAELANLKFGSAKTEESKEAPKKTEKKAEKSVEAPPAETAGNEAAPEADTKAEEFAETEVSPASDESSEAAETAETASEEVVAEETTTETTAEETSEPVVEETSEASAETAETSEESEAEPETVETQEVEAEPEIVETQEVEAEAPETEVPEAEMTAEDSGEETEEVEEQTAKG